MNHGCKVPTLFLWASLMRLYTSVRFSAASRESASPTPTFIMTRSIYALCILNESSAVLTSSAFGRTACAKRMIWLAAGVRQELAQNVPLASCPTNHDGEESSLRMVSTSRTGNCELHTDGTFT